MDPVEDHFLFKRAAGDSIKEGKIRKRSTLANESNQCWSKERKCFNGIGFNKVTQFVQKKFYLEVDGFQEKMKEDIQTLAYKTGLKKWQVVFAMLGKYSLIKIKCRNVFKFFCRKYLKNGSPPQKSCHPQNMEKTLRTEKILKI